ncbi:MAG: DUF192 domain-containing protein [Oceanococcus sp.]
MKHGRVQGSRHQKIAYEFNCDRTQTSLERAYGLLGQTEVAEPLWISPCRSIHMWFMKMPLDLVYLDRAGSICKLVACIKPWQLSFCWRAHSVIEMAAGSIGVYSLQIKDELQWCE